MKYYFINLIKLLLLLFLSHLIAQTTHAKNSDKTKNLDQKKIEQQVNALVKEYQDLDIFSGVVLIVEKDKPIYHKAFGLADRQKNIKNTIKTKFDIGSMNKTFTKMIILQLIQEGKLTLNQKLSDILETFKHDAYKNITVAHLLNHTAGFGDYFNTEGFFDLPASEKNIDSLIKKIRSMPLLFPAGEENEYSNSGYIVLGAIIEKITGDKYHQYVKDKIVDVLKLQDTFVKDKNSVPDRAIGYLKSMKGELEDNQGFVEVPNPDGGFQSTAMDVWKFYQEFHYGNTIVNQETKMKDEVYSMMQDHKTTGGALPHAGGFNGANTVNLEILRDKISIVVLANMDEPVAEQLGSGILAIVRGKEPTKPSLPAIQKVYSAFMKNGGDYVKKHFNELTTNFHPTDPKGMILNSIGYEFLKENNTDKAIEVFLLNTEIFGHEDPNVWDSLGEAYYTKGQKNKAIISYEKALQMDPELPSSQSMIEKIKKEINPE